MHPYKKLPQDKFWKLFVAQKNFLEINDLWDPKFNIELNDKIVSYGSCFAQHIGQALKSRGYKWMIFERPPHSLAKESCKVYNYNIFSARTGNIYTTSLLKQWIEWSIDPDNIPDETWLSNSRYFDPFRPAIEPLGFENKNELVLSRLECLNKFHTSILKSDVFIFTMGLTECWINSDKGYEYPLCPGTIAGEFNDELHSYKNSSFSDVYNNLVSSLDLIRKINPKIKVILTVSPVPLTATKSANNVLVATMHSKSILRAVAGEVSSQYDFVDYFPSYEIINSPVYQGAFFNTNKRGVSRPGVNFVMNSFFISLHGKYGSPFNVVEEREVADIKCEEELLEAFGND
ncbi:MULTISPECIES: GSCFA domain-containing protein [Cobetia]|uniref:GSCFA domain-containing protein n=1 Tax=Cobetia TaxID=204286 RepID=UPI00158387F3|nr:MULTISPECIES: GSCFA domain-containing protein [Cobetia]MDI4661943.1 GSCFA domain-containing protein [Cobetia sp. BMC6]NUJ57507.1 GSCFA domain-containing protein [Cobetia marina]